MLFANRSSKNWMNWDFLRTNNQTTTKCLQMNSVDAMDVIDAVWAFYKKDINVPETGDNGRYQSMR